MFMLKKTLLCILLIGIIPAAAHALPVVTVFGPQELEGAPGLFGGAVATVSIFETASGGGTIDFALTNTSLRTEMALDMFANAFITEFQFDMPGDFEPVYAQCSVIARTGVRFAQGAGNPVIATDVERMLDWEFGNGTGGGMYARAYEATQNSNNNAIFSCNALDAGGIPVEDYAVGFLENGGGWEGGVFDTIVFRVKLDGLEPITEDDLSFFACDHLTLKFQGGNGSAWVPNDCSIPEPATLFLLASALPAALWAVRRKRLRKG